MITRKDENNLSEPKTNADEMMDMIPKFRDIIMVIPLSGITVICGSDYINTTY